VSNAENCFKCKFFLPSNESCYLGSCRRFPPKRINQHDSLFPEVGNTWCGEFKLSDKAIEEKTLSEANEVLSESIYKLDLTLRSSNCLRSAKINTIGDLIKWRRGDLKKIIGLGLKSESEIKRNLESEGWRLRYQSEGIHPDVKAYFDAKN